MIPQTPHDWAQFYTKLGCAPIPLHPKTKQPAISAWQQLKIPAGEILNYFDAADSNIGVVLGELSGGLVDIDLDVAEAVEAALVLLPETRIFGRQSRPASHYLYRCADAVTRKYQYNGTMLVEIRSSGAQTMMPGSIHPDGELVRFENNHKVVELSFAYLQGQVGEVAAAALLARLLNEMNGTRHDTCLAAAGALLHGGMGAPDVETFMGAVLLASGDEERVDRLRAVKDSIRNYGKGKQVSGWPTLSKLLPADAIEKLRTWLQIQDIPKLKINGVAYTATGESVAQSAPVAPPPEPEPLYRELPPAEEYPVEALGDVLAPMAKAMQEIIQAPAALCGQSVLAAATLAVQAHANVELRGRVFPASLYFVTVADSGERKSTCDRAALAPHHKFQRSRLELREQDLLDYEISKAAYEHSRAAALKSKDALTREDREEALKALGPPPVMPANPLILVEEPTYEGLVKHLHIGWPSVGLFSDEGGRFIGGYAMSGDHMLKTASGLSGLWDGTSVTRTRSGDGTTWLTGRRLSLHLMVQPAVSGLLFGNEMLASQGLLSRLLVTRPESTIGKRMYRDEALPDRAEAARYFARMMDILEHPLPLVEKGSMQLDPRPVTLDAAAMALWVQYHDHVEQQLKPEEELHDIKGLAAKAGEQTARLALVLALSDDIDTGIIRPQYMEAAIALSEFHLTEALRLFHIAPMDSALQKAADLGSWLRTGASVHNRWKWSTRDICRTGPKRLRSKKDILTALEILENHYWVVHKGQRWEVVEWRTENS
jgi:hypothetical protein